jgi:hypothetical protein
MSAVDWAALLVSIMTIMAGFTAAIRWLVKHYLYELKPNSGSSLKDSVTRLEAKVEVLYQILIEKGEHK